jgi:hypothetical protein
LPDEVAAIEPLGWFEAVERREVNVVVEAYAGPAPSVELVVPAGYRGPLKVEVLARDDAPAAPGQRCFRCVVPPSGVAQVVGPPLLKRVLGPDIRASYADGTPLPQSPKGAAEVGLWLVKWEGSNYSFLVGTRDEYLSRRPASSRIGEGSSSQPGRGKGGGGRGGRRNRGDPAAS